MPSDGKSFRRGLRNLSFSLWKQNKRLSEIVDFERVQSRVNRAIYCTISALERLEDCEPARLSYAKTEDGKRANNDVSATSGSGISGKNCPIAVFADGDPHITKKPIPTRIMGRSAREDPSLEN